MTGDNAPFVCFTSIGQYVHKLHIIDVCRKISSNRNMWSSLFAIWNYLELRLRTGQVFGTMVGEGGGGAGEGRGRGCSEDLKGHLAMQLFLPSVLKYKIFFIANDLKTLTRLDETANVIS